MDELKPCPFCGSRKVLSGEILGLEGKRHFKQNVCDDCDATGPTAYLAKGVDGPAGDELSDAAWNRRAAHGGPASVSMDGEPMGDPHPCDMTPPELDRCLGGSARNAGVAAPSTAAAGTRNEGAK